MDDFTRVRTFIKVVEAGSFSAAARDVASISSVARQVKSLEEELGVRLLNRSTRSLSLTDSGRRFYELAVAIAHDLDSTLSQVKALQEDVKGLLRVSLHLATGTTVVVPALPRLLARYPELQVDITLSDQRPDLLANKIDVAMWLGEVDEPGLVACRLSASRRVVCGSPAYFSNHGIPATPQDLRQHNCLVLGGPSFRNRWGFVGAEEQQEVEVHGSLRSDNALALLSSGLAGLGIVIAHEWMVRHLLADARLVRVLSNYVVSPRPGDLQVYAVYAASRGLSQKMRVFIDFLVETFEGGSP